MVLELRVPKGQDLRDLLTVLPLIAIYALSFICLAIYWNNHHHMFQAAQKVSGGVLWSNASFVLALVSSVHNRMDGSALARVMAGGHLRCQPAAVRNCLLHSCSSIGCTSWQRFDSRTSVALHLNPRMAPLCFQYILGFKCRIHCT
jgi:hypothetical protein